jgi:hypothetical protein
MKRATFIASLALAATPIAAGSASAATTPLPMPRHAVSFSRAHRVGTSFLIEHPKLRGLAAPKPVSKPSNAGGPGAPSVRAVMHTQDSFTGYTFDGWQAANTAGYYFAMFYEYSDGAYNWEADYYSWDGSTLQYQDCYYPKTSDLGGAWSVHGPGSIRRGLSTSWGALREL